MLIRALVITVIAGLFLFVVFMPGPSQTNLGREIKSPPNPLGGQP